MTGDASDRLIPDVMHRREVVSLRPRDLITLLSRLEGLPEVPNAYQTGNQGCTRDGHHGGGGKGSDLLGGSSAYMVTTGTMVTRHFAHCAMERTNDIPRVMSH
jgi:hypothetical protein